MDLPFDPPLAPMEAKTVADIPIGDGWQYEPKWDGFRAICFRADDDVFISSRKELPFARYFPEIVAALRVLGEPRVILDGELVIFSADGRSIMFDTLQMRLHPAESRIRKLSAEIPASFVAFDLLARGDRDVREAPLAERRALLEEVMAGAKPPLHLSPCTSHPELARSWLDRFAVAGLDGVVAKRLDGTYEPGERAMRKIKRQRTADCVVTGWRWAKDQRGAAVGSLLLGLYSPEGELPQVGFVSGFDAKTRRDLVPVLEEHRSGPTVEVPNSPEYRSRWNADKDLSFEPLKPELVVEVSFDQVTGDRIRHGARFVRWRPDKPASACTFEQLHEAGDFDVSDLLGPPGERVARAEP
jgi:bifunctional non-homologous end joining protein LigD